MNHWTFCNQTLYGDASLYARVSCGKMGCYLQGQGPNNWVWGHSWNHDGFCYMFWTVLYGFFPSDLLCLRPSRSKYNTSTINYLLGVFSTVWPKLVCSELLIFWGDQFSLTVHAHKLECLAKRLFCCIQGQGHSDGSELQWMFARTISLGQVVKHVSDQGNQHNNGPRPRSDFW